MTDFLKANPYVRRDEYLWEWTIPQIRLASYDYTHVEYLSEKEIEKKKRKSIDSAEDLLNDLGTSIFTINKECLKIYAENSNHKKENK